MPFTCALDMYIQQPPATVENIILLIKSPKQQLDFCSPLAVVMKTIVAGHGCQRSERDSQRVENLVSCVLPRLQEMGNTDNGLLIHTHQLNQKNPKLSVTRTFKVTVIKQTSHSETEDKLSIYFTDLFYYGPLETSVYVHDEMLSGL